MLKIKRTLTLIMVLAAALVGAVALAQGGKNPVVVFETSLGNIEVELFADKAPISTKNILGYVEKGYYDGLIFHRVIPGFMVQGGGYSADLKEKQPDAPIKNEAQNGLSNKRGTLAMARTNVVDSATSQFFINVADNNRLDHAGEANFGYAVFGKVLKGMDVVDKIVAVQTCPASGASVCKQSLPFGMRDVPAEPVTIKKATKKK